MTETTEKKSIGSKIGKALLIFFKVLSKALSISAKVTKLALAGVSLAAYTYMYSWKFALILMFQLLIHEYGHIWAMKKVGIKTKGIYFIPFVGGAAVASEDFKSRRDEVFIALMGPVFGFGCALIMMVLYYCTDNPMYAAGASWMAMMNLFNLLPINPLDGGRVMKSIAFSINSWIGLIFMGIGIVASIVLAFMAHIWIFVLVVILSSIEFSVEIYFHRKTVKRNKKLNDDLNEIRLEWKVDPIEDVNEITQKPPMSLLEITYSTLAYFALAFVLYWFMASTMHIPGASFAMEMLVK